MKAGNLDWSELLTKSDKEYKHKPTTLFINNSQGVALKGEAVPRFAKGEVPYRPSNEEIAKAVLHNAPKQPTDVELFGGGVITEEQAKKAEEEWNNKLNKTLTMPNIGKPLEKEEWGMCKSFNSSLTPEELAKRNIFTGE